MKNLVASLKKVNTLLGKGVIDLEKSQAKTEQYSRKNNVEISGIPHEILDNDLGDEVIDICKDAGIEIWILKIAIDCHLVETTLLASNVLLLNL